MDLVSLFNEAQTDTVLSNVKVTSYSSSTNELVGSGVIINEDNSYYYCLTNHHVVYTNSLNQNISITDPYLNVATAIILCKDVNYDLALLKFPKQDKLKVATIADYEIFKNELVFAIGQPNGLANTITFGYLYGKKENIPDQSTIELSNITFDIYYSNAKIEPGSSGGALFDSNLNLVGVNFGSCYNSNDEYVSTETIPSAKILDFLHTYTDF